MSQIPVRFGILFLLTLTLFVGVDSTLAKAELRNLRPGMDVPPPQEECVRGGHPSADGKAIIYGFFALWSTDSRTVLKYLAQNRDEWQKAGLHIVLIDADAPFASPQEAAQAAAFARDSVPDFCCLLDTELAYNYEIGVIALPTLVLADNQGRLFKAFSGWSPSMAHLLNQYLDSLLYGKPLVGGMEERVPNPRALRYASKGMVLERRRLLDSAEIAYRRSLDIDSLYVPAMARLARLSHFAKKEEESRSLLVRGMAIDSTEPEILVGMAEYSLNHSDSTRARDLLARVTTENPHYLPGWQVLMAVLSAEGRGKQLGEMADKVLSLRRDNTRAMYYRARSMQLKGQNEQARTAYAKLLARYTEPVRCAK